jgi:hypothetical protein
MALEGIILADMVVNSGFAIIAIFIILSFLSKFKGDVPLRQGNVIGFILLSLGLTFHIIGHLFAVTVSDANPDSGSLHFIMAFKSLAVGLFILGSLILAHYIAKSPKSRRFLKIFAYVYSLLSILDASFHIATFFDESLLGDGEDIERSFLVVEMVSLTIVYFVLFLQSRKTIRRVASVRYQLLAFASIGFVLVILVDLLIQLSVITIAADTLTIFTVFFILHVITVGALYLLVIFPKRFQLLIGVDQAIPA